MSIQVCNLVHPFIYVSMLCPIEMYSEQNKVIAVTGGNGCGKTTFLRLLLKDLTPKRGSIGVSNNISFLGTKNILKPQVLLKKQLPYFLDDNASFPWPQFLDIRFQELSKGQQRLISLWIIFQTTHSIILLDEPFSHLDTNAKNLVCQWIEESIKQGRTIVLTNHTIDNLSTISNIQVLDLSF